jgi:sugar O-acyltransferase (sialic acid O-acetyltransferase NeuD family)
MDKILIIGAGGLAREFTSWFKDRFEIVGYSSNEHKDHSEFNLPGALYTENVTPDLIGTDLAVICIGNPGVKKQVYNDFSRVGFSFPTIIHHSSVLSEWVTLKEGVVIAPQCVVSPNAKIGKLTYINFCCGIGHDALVGDFVQMNPGSQIGGGSKIGDEVLIGSSSAVLQGVSIGDGSTVAFGAVVFSRVSQGATVMGNPARRMPALDKNFE